MYLDVRHIVIERRGHSAEDGAHRHIRNSRIELSLEGEGERGKKRLFKSRFGGAEYPPLK